MKLIFDFDDVLFNNTKQFKDHMYACLENAGISRIIVKTEYMQVRATGVPFSLKKFLETLNTKYNVGTINAADLYAEILYPAKNFLNQDLIAIAEKAGRENCYLVTNGEEEFQKDKIAQTGIAPLFAEVHIVPQGKKEVISEIYNEHKKDKFIFIEDRTRFIDELNLKDMPNLTIIHFDEDGLKKLQEELSQHLN